MLKKYNRVRCSVGIIATLLLLCTPRPGFCWDKFGHEVACQIAYDRLTPTTRQHVNAIVAQMANDPLVLGLSDDLKPYNFVTAGAWMDDIRSETKEFNAWHYIDLPTNTDVTADDVAAFHDNNPMNAYIAITTKCLPTLNDPNAADADKARMLAFFLHIAADLHQPLHANGRDLGGNHYPIDQLPGADPNWHITNLHSFWDNAYRYGVKDGKVFVQVTGLDVPRVKNPGDDPVRTIAKEFESKYAPLNMQEAHDANSADWAVESDRIASTFVYPAGNPTTLGTMYIQRAHDVACQRLTLAGYRIATVLNGIYGK